MNSIFKIGFTIILIIVLSPFILHAQDPSSNDKDGVIEKTAEIVKEEVEKLWYKRWDFAAGIAGTMTFINAGLVGNENLTFGSAYIFEFVSSRPGFDFTPYYEKVSAGVLNYSGYGINFHYNITDNDGSMGPKFFGKPTLGIGVMDVEAAETDDYLLPSTKTMIGKIGVKMLISFGSNYNHLIYYDFMYLFGGKVTNITKNRFQNVESEEELAGIIFRFGYAYVF